MMPIVMFRDTEKLPFFPDYLKLHSQNTRKLVRKKPNKPTQNHKIQKTQTETPKLPNNFLPI